MPRAAAKKPISALHLRKILRYDPDSGFFYWLINRTNGVKVGDRAGSAMSNGYRRIGINNSCCSEHRLAWLYTHGEWPDGEIDHINLDRTDNRLANLRKASRSQNNMNQRGRSDNRSSRFKGVTWHKKCLKWQASIKKNGRNHYLGLFDTEDGAHAAYCTAVEELHGDYGRTA